MGMWGSELDHRALGQVAWSDSTAHLHGSGEVCASTGQGCFGTQRGTDLTGQFKSDQHNNNNKKLSSSASSKLDPALDLKPMQTAE